MSRSVLFSIILFEWCCCIWPLDYSDIGVMNTVLRPGQTTPGVNDLQYDSVTKREFSDTQNTGAKQWINCSFMVVHSTRQN